VQIHTIRQTGDTRREVPEIPKTGCPNRGARRVPVHVDDVSADRHVNRDRDAETMRSDHQASVRKVWVRLGQVRANRLTESLLLDLCVTNYLVENPPSLFRHPETTRTESLIDVLGCRARQRDLEVMDDTCSIHRQRRNVATLHQVDQYRRYAGLDHVSADAPDDAGLTCARINDR